jgi:hypothetical protein
MEVTAPSKYAGQRVHPQPDRLAGPYAQHVALVHAQFELEGVGAPDRKEEIAFGRSAHPLFQPRGEHHAGDGAQW